MAGKTLSSIKLIQSASHTTPLCTTTCLLIPAIDLQTLLQKSTYSVGMKITQDGIVDFASGCHEVFSDDLHTMHVTAACGRTHTNTPPFPRLHIIWDITVGISSVITLQMCVYVYICLCVCRRMYSQMMRLRYGTDKKR